MEKKICVICEKAINFNKDKFVRLTDFTGKKQDSECFYHLDCWKNRFTLTQEKIQRSADEWMNKLGVTINSLKNKMGVENVKIPA